MVKDISNGLTGDELLKHLYDETHESVTMGYTHKFTNEEIILKKDEFFKVSNELAVLEEEEKLRREAYKEQVKPLKEQTAELRLDIRHGNRWVKNALCHKAYENDTNLVGIYSPQGILIEERPINPNDPKEAQYFLPTNKLLKIAS